MKRTIIVFSLLLFGSILFGCNNELKINVINELTIKAGDTANLNASATDGAGVLYFSSDEEVIVVDDNGLITGLQEGNAECIVKSKTDQNIFSTVNVTVEKGKKLLVSEYEVQLDPSDRYQLEVDTDVEIKYSSSNEAVATVTSSGLITAKKIGSTVITIASRETSSFARKVKVTVAPMPNAIFITGNENINIGQTITYTISPIPDTASKKVYWSVSNEQMATISSKGELKALKEGEVKVIAKHQKDDSIKDEITVRIKNVLLVKSDANKEDIICIDGVDLTLENGIFTSLSAALNKAISNTKIYLTNGEHSDEYLIDKEGVSFVGLKDNTALIKGNIKIAAKNVKIENLKFSGITKITNENNVEGFVFDRNDVSNITVDDAFIKFVDVKSVTITNNTFSLNNINAIDINNANGGEIIIRSNNINNAKDGIKINVLNDAASNTAVKVTRNNINKAFNALVIKTLDANILAHARYNVITNSRNKNVINDYSSKVDYSLNYWGDPDPEQALFDQVSDYNLAWIYKAKEEILKEEYERADVPALIFIDNPLEQFHIKRDSDYKMELSFLPHDYVHERKNINFFSTDETVATLSIIGILDVKKQGPVTLGARSAYFGAIKADMDVKVITDPGIEVIPSINKYALLTTETLKLDANLYPYILEDKVNFKSSDETIATIDEYGNVTAKRAGKVEFSAYSKVIFESQEVNLESKYAVEFYDQFDESKIMDIIASYQFGYTESRSFSVKGYQGTWYYSGFLSSSYLLFGQNAINVDYIPVGNDNRPGLKPALPSNITKYNDDNIYWVIVHDTANIEGTARNHASYIKEPKTETSWHYTVDDLEIWKHLPENEKAWHAADGNTSPGYNGNYIGGGNANGVGIETGVVKNSDMLLCWHRTANLVADILVRNNLPFSQLKYHNDCSGKDCPSTMRGAGMVKYFEELAKAEHKIRKSFPGAIISMESSNPTYLSNAGRVIKLPKDHMTIEYTVTAIYNGNEESKTFAIYLPGSESLS